MKRRIARQMAIQSLYQLDMTAILPQQAVDMIVQETAHDNEINIRQADAEAVYEEVLQWVSAVWTHRKSIDECLIHYLRGWKLERLSRVDKQILRLAIYEWKYRDDVPPKVVINEAVYLAKYFGMDESGKFVNGVLGQMMREWDPTIQTKTSSQP